MTAVNDITITSLETITVFDVVTGAYKFTLDELQNATIAQTQEATEITGRGGRKLSTIKRNKAVTLSGTNGMVSGGLMELQTGGTFEEKTTEVLWTDYLTVKDKKATTTWKAVGTTGKEIEELYIRNTDGTLGKELEQNEAEHDGEGKFSYSPNSKELSFHEDVTDGTEVVVYYKRKITADVLDNRSDKVSGKGTIYVDALGEDECANVYRVQFYLPKADFSGEFSLEMGENQTVHSFECEALSGACGRKDLFFTYTVFGANTKDATP